MQGLSGQDLLVVGECVGQQQLLIGNHHVVPDDLIQRSDEDLAESKGHLLPQLVRIHHGVGQKHHRHSALASGVRVVVRNLPHSELLVEPRLEADGLNMRRVGRCGPESRLLQEAPRRRSGDLRVHLKSGGYIVIDETEALVTIRFTIPDCP